MIDDQAKQYGSLLCNAIQANEIPRPQIGAAIGGAALTPVHKSVREEIGIIIGRFAEFEMHNARQFNEVSKALSELFARLVELENSVGR